MKRQWFYEVDQKASGPVSREELERLFADGRLDGQRTLVWTKGMPSYVGFAEAPTDLELDQGLPPEQWRGQGDRTGPTDPVQSVRRGPARQADAKWRLTWPNVIPALIGATVYAVVASTPSTGVLIFSTLVLAPWAIYSLVVILTRAERRKLQAAQLAIWALAFGVASVAIDSAEDRARAAANQAIAAVDAYTRQHGVCPQTLEDAGYSRAAYREAVGRLGSYSCDEGRPHLWYADPSMPFNTKNYSFSSRTWELQD